MKKTLTGFCAALMLLSGTHAAFADTVYNTGVDPNDPKQNIYVGTGVLISVADIDLDFVLDRALNQSYNLNLLSLKYAALSNKQGDLTEQRKELEGGAIPAARSLPDTPLAMINAMQTANPGLVVDPAQNLWLGPVTTVTNKAINEVVKGMGQMASGMNEMISKQREQMRTTVHSLETDGRNTLLQQKEAKEGIRLQTIAQYAQLLGMKKQLGFMQAYQAVIEKELLKAQLFAQQGLASPDDVQTATRALSKQKDDIAVLTNNYRLALVQLSFDIGIAYNPELTVKDIPYISLEPVKRSDPIQLLNQSYQMKMAANNIDEANWQGANGVTTNVYGSYYLGANAGIAGQKNEQTKLELSKKIYATYNDADNAYQACVTEQRNLDDVKADLAKMKQRFDAGVISKHDLNKFEIKVRQGETTLEAAKLKYYALKEKAAAMERGFIQ